MAFEGSWTSNGPKKQRLKKWVHSSMNIQNDKVSDVKISATQQSLNIFNSV